MSEYFPDHPRSYDESRQHRTEAVDWEAHALFASGALLTFNERRISDDDRSLCRPRSHLPRRLHL